MAVICTLAGLWLPIWGCGGTSPRASLQVEVARVELPYGEIVRVPVEWRCLEQLPAGDLILFVHLLDTEKRIVRTFDQPFSPARVAGCKVTTPIYLWQSVLGPPIDAGSYSLRVGLVSESDGRLPLAVEGVEGERNAYTVLEVQVPATSSPGAGLPELIFRGSWKPPSGAEDRQLPGQRWLERSGEISVRIDRPRRLELVLRLLDAEAVGLRAVLDEGETEPRIGLRADCNGGAGWLVGAQTHEVSVDYLPETFPAECTLWIEPNYTFLDATTLARSSVGLERATWRDLSPEPAGEPE